MVRRLIKGLPDPFFTSELFTPGQEAAGARPSRAQVRNSSSETHLLKTVASGGAWHSQEDGEEALVTGPNFRQTDENQGWALEWYL